MNLTTGTNSLAIWVNTASQLFTKAITSISGLALTFIIGRYLGAAGYGDYTKIATYIAFFYLVADFGLNAIYIKKNPDPDTDPEWFNLAFLRFGLSLLLNLVALGILVFLPKDNSQGFTDMVKLGILIYSPTIVFQGLLLSANGYFQKYLKYHYSTVAVATGSVLALIMVYTSTKIFVPAVAFINIIAALTISSFVTAVAALSFVRNKFKPDLKIDLKKIINLLADSLPLGLTLIFNVVYFRIDIIFLTIMRNTYEVGIYGLAYKFFETALVFPVFYMNSIYPGLVTAKLNGDKDIFIRRINRSLLTVLGISGLGTAVIWFLAPYLTVINPDFAGSILILRILGLGLPIFYVSAVYMWGIITLGKQWLLMIIYLTAGIFNIIVNYVIIPKYGIAGAAITTLLTELYTTALLVNLFYKSYKENYEDKS